MEGREEKNSATVLKVECQGVSAPEMTEDIEFDPFFIDAAGNPVHTETKEIIISKLKGTHWLLKGEGGTH